MRFVRRLRSADGSTVKHVWALGDGNTIDTVHIRFATYDSLCISSQVGCSLACAFCASGLGGRVRDLTAAEIAGQVESTFADLGPPGRPFSVALMGIGEPLLNLDAVLEARVALESWYPGTTYSLSTVGIVPKIYELAERNVNFYLQLSLHAPNDALRARIMPVTRKYPIREVLDAARHYASSSGKTLIVNYLLLDGVNDSDAHVGELVDRLRDLPACLKISRYNAIAELDFAPVADERHRAFEDSCSRAGLPVYHFTSMGADIEGGCGQLRPLRSSR